MTDRPRDPLANTARLVVDGTNLLHALSGNAGRLPPAAIIGRLRGVIPAATSIDLVFDGPAEAGLRGERIASGLRVRYSGARSADELILSLVEGIRNTHGPEATAGILVVTDDRELRNRLRARGARSAGTTWMISRLERGRMAAPAAGNRRPPLHDAGAEDDDRPGWRPGRSATRKRGPSHRTRRGARDC